MADSSEEALLLRVLTRLELRLLLAASDSAISTPSSSPESLRLRLGAGRAGLALPSLGAAAERERPLICGAL